MRAPGPVRGLTVAARRAVSSVRRGDAPVGSQWCRLVMNERISAVLDGLPAGLCDAVEVSGDQHGGRPWRSYRRLSYPEFDLCSPSTVDQYDVVICEQVIEHVRDPGTAVSTLRELCRPGGVVVVSTPFLVRVHREPEDFWRFTPSGLRHLLEGAGLEVVSVSSWGNAACVSANFRRWVGRRRWDSLADDPDLPVVVWAVARRAGAEQ